ncbi:MAG TPA: HlyD family secretion protein [Stellaceae bacterium]|nr:HlyD family secretion protein [Stellaceae bacterium]
MSKRLPLAAERPVRPTPQFEPIGRPPPAPEPERKSGLRRGFALVLGAILLLALIAGGTLWWLEARQYESTDDAFIDVHMVRVAPQVAGRVAHVLVDDNQLVAAGAPLIEIDPADFQAKLDQALATQASAAAGLAQAKAQGTVAQANAEESRAEVAVAQANAINAAEQLKRDQPLAAQHVVSTQQLGNDLASQRSTSANMVAAQKKESAADAQLAVVATQIDAAQANLASAQAQVTEARLDLSYTRIAAPVAGRIAHKNVSPGDYVQIGQNLMALVPTNVWITANFKETQLALMRVGQPVDIRVDAYPGVTFKGHVDSFQPGSGAAFSLLPPENATGNYVKVVQRVPVKIVFDDPPDPNRPLGPGMSVVPSVKVR